MHKDVRSAGAGRGCHFPQLVRRLWPRSARRGESLPTSSGSHGMNHGAFVRGCASTGHRGRVPGCPALAVGGLRAAPVRGHGQGLCGSSEFSVSAGVAPRERPSAPPERPGYCAGGKQGTLAWMVPASSEKVELSHLT